MAWIRLRARFFVALAAGLACCVLAEVGLQAREYLRTPMCVQVSDSRVYALNPAYPEISSLGFRNREIVIPKPSGLYRVAILGDSVAFGVGVARRDAFPQRMHRTLSSSDAMIEVVNCGVPGYSTYNELELYRMFASALQADLVILAVCLNDVVSPRLHWATAGLDLDAVGAIPASAIPDLEFDRQRVVPMLARQRRIDDQRPMITRSAFLRAVFDAIAQPFAPASTADAPRTPTYLAFEDPTSIEVLCSDGTPQWNWLVARIADLDRSVAVHRGKLIVVFFPLAYQMDSGYPLSPQSRLSASCTSNSISSVDMLPALLGHTKASMFRLGTGEYYDIWHLTPRGHEVVAETLCSYVVEGRAELLRRGDGRARASTVR